METCQESHRRLLATLNGLDDAAARAPSKLPDWTVGHVLTHLARNADGHARRLAAALRGESVPRYVGGVAQRNGEIDEGHGRPASVLVDDVRESAAGLEAVWRQCAEAGWSFDVEPSGDDWPLAESPVHRLREVEVHHVDLGLGYGPEQWPDEYQRWELAQALRGLPSRLAPGDARRFLATLLGRADWPSDVSLGPWDT